MLVNLFRDKKIHPPPKIANYFNTIIMNQENQKVNRNPRQSNPEPTETHGRKRFSKSRKQKEPE
jgi:hypothetical protein